MYDASVVRQSAQRPALRPQNPHLVASNACKAWPSTTAHTASTGSVLPAIGSGRWALTVGLWLGEVAELAAAAVQCAQWPRVWWGTRLKSPVSRTPMEAKWDNSDRVGGRWTAGKLDAERAGASGDGLQRAPPHHQLACEYGGPWGRLGERETGRGVSYVCATGHAAVRGGRLR